MTYENREAGRVTEQGFQGRKGNDCAGFWTFDAVEERLIEAMLLWKRSPGGGRWPFAGDGPWHLLTKETRAGDYDARGGDMVETAEPRPLPLTRADVARRDEASEWLRLVAERDRPVVVAALLALAGGAKHVPWMKLKHRLGVKFGARGLQMRYDRAIAGVAKALNAADFREGAVSTRQSSPPSK